MCKRLLKVISIVVLFAFTLNTTSYGLGVLPASQNGELKREMEVALAKTKVIYAESDDDFRLLKANNAKCLLLSSGKYLVDRAQIKDDLSLMRAIIHEDIEAMMQIIWHESLERNPDGKVISPAKVAEDSPYDLLKKELFAKFPIQGKYTDKEEGFYLNDLVARAFDLIIPVAQGLVYEGDLKADEKAFLELISPTIENLSGYSITLAQHIKKRDNVDMDEAKTGIFGREFWDTNARKERIAQAMRDGFWFYKVSMSERDDDTRTILSTINPAQQGAGYNELRQECANYAALLRESNDQVIILGEALKPITDFIVKVYGINPEEIKAFLKHVSPEPKSAWERLLIIVEKGKIGFAVDDREHHENEMNKLLRKFNEVRKGKYRIKKEREQKAIGEVKPVDLSGFHEYDKLPNFLTIAYAKDGDNQHPLYEHEYEAEIAGELQEIDNRSLSVTEVLNGLKEMRDAKQEELKSAAAGKREKINSEIEELSKEILIIEKARDSLNSTNADLRILESRINRTLEGFASIAGDEKELKKLQDDLSDLEAEQEKLQKKKDFFEAEYLKRPITRYKKRLKKLFKNRFTPFYLIHVDKNEWDESHGDLTPAQKAKILVAQWTEHFMPSFRRYSGEQHAKLQVEFFDAMLNDASITDENREAKRAEHYDNIFKTISHKVVLTKSAVSNKKLRIQKLYGNLDNYRTYEDPTGELLESIYLGLRGHRGEEITMNDLLSAIATDGHLRAFYRYLFDNPDFQLRQEFNSKHFIDVVTRLHKEKILTTDEIEPEDPLPAWVKSFNRTEKSFSYEDRVTAISLVLEVYRGRVDTIDINIDLAMANAADPASKESPCFFMAKDPLGVIKTPVYVPSNIFSRFNPAEFDKLKLDDKNVLVMASKLNDVQAAQNERDGYRDRRDAIKRGLDDGMYAGSKIPALEAEIKEYNKRITALNGFIDKTNSETAKLYTEGFVNFTAGIAAGLINDERKKGGQSEVVVIGVYGPSSSGKTTNCVNLMNELINRGFNADYLGSDSYLHPGKGFRYDQDFGKDRYTYLRGQGIYDIERFIQDIDDIKGRNRGVKIPADSHSPNYNENMITRGMHPGVEVIVVDLTVLGMTERMSARMDMIIPMVFTPGTIRLDRRIERDTRTEQEGTQDRVLSLGYCFGEFAEKQFTELKDNMWPLVMEGFRSSKSVIWVNKKNHSEFWTKKKIVKKAPGMEALNDTERDYIDSKIKDAVLSGKTEDVVLDDVFSYLETRGPPEDDNETKAIIENFKAAVRSGTLKVRACDVGEYAGFQRNRNASKASELVFAKPTEEEGTTYINITKVMQFLTQPYVSGISEEQKQVRTAALTQLLLHEWSEINGYAHSQAVKLELIFSSDYSSSDDVGVTDIDLLILRQAAEDNDTAYFEKLFIEYDGSKDPEGKFLKAVTNAFSKLLFLHYAVKDMPQVLNTITLHLTESEPGDTKQEMITEAIDEALDKATRDVAASVNDALENIGIFKKQDLRGTAHEMDLNNIEQISYEVAYRLGYSIAETYRNILNKDKLKLALGKDARVHSPRLYRAMKQALTEAGVNVVEIAQGNTVTTTPMVSTVVYRYPDLDGAVQITSSHNDFTFNGFKIFLQQKNLPSDVLEHVVRSAADINTTPRKEQGVSEDKTRDFREAYKQEVIAYIRAKFDGQAKPLRGKKYAIEGVNGTSGELFAEAIEACGGKAVRLHCDKNGYFPYFTPNPDEREARVPLIALMKEDQDIESGVTFDSDGDRLFFVSKGGKEISNHELECLFADKLEGPVVLNSRSTMAVSDVKDEHRTVNGAGPSERAYKCKSGYSYVKAMSEHVGAVAGMEESGHFMFRDNNYIDDGMKTAALVFGYAAESDKGLKEDIDATLPYARYESVFTINTKKLPAGTIEEKQKTVAVLNAFQTSETEHFRSIEGCRVWDQLWNENEAWKEAGLYVEFDENIWGFRGWFQFRPSLSEPNKAYLDFEASVEGNPSPAGVWTMMSILRDRLSRYPRLAAATELLNPESIAANETLSDDVRGIAEGEGPASVESINDFNIKINNTANPAEYLLVTTHISGPRRSLGDTLYITPQEFWRIQNDSSMTLTPDDKAKLNNMFPNTYASIMRKNNISQIRDVMDENKPYKGYDVIIIATTVDAERNAMQKQFDDLYGPGRASGDGATVIAVNIGQISGRGQVLDGMQAYEVAKQELAARNGENLDELWKKGATIGIVLNAGEGKRDSTLTHSESGSRGAINLGGDLSNGDPVTLLNLTYAQNSVFAPSNRGYVDILYASQILIPSEDVAARKAPGTINGLMIKFVNNINKESDITAATIKELGIYVTDENGNVIDNYPKGTYGNTVEKVKEKFKAETADGKKKWAYSLGSHRVKREFFFALREYLMKHGGGVENMEWRVEPPDFIRPIIMHMIQGMSQRNVITILVSETEAAERNKGKSDEEVLKAGRKALQRTGQIFDFFNWYTTVKDTNPENFIGLFGVGSDIHWWKYRNPNVVLNNALLMLADYSGQLVSINENGATEIKLADTKIKEEAKDIRELHGINIPVSNVKLGDVQVNAKGEYIVNGISGVITEQDIKKGINVGGVYIKNSIVSNSTISEGSSVVSSVVEKFEGKILANNSFIEKSQVPAELEVNNGLVYNVIEKNRFVADGIAVIDVYREDINDTRYYASKTGGQTRTYVEFGVDGSTADKIKLPDNMYTFNELRGVGADNLGAADQVRKDVLANSTDHPQYEAVKTMYHNSADNKDYRVYTLADKNARSKIMVVPERGATVFSMRVNVNGRERDVLYQPADITKSGGIPVLWPFANRIKEGKFEWEGEVHELSGVVGTKNDANGHTYHGMVRYAPWKVEATGSDAEGAYIRLGFNTIGTEIEKHFGKAKFTLTYRLKGSKLTMNAHIRNMGNKPLPNTLAFHPWINTGTNENKEKSEVQLPAAKHWESDAEHIPTGTLEDVTGKHDLRVPTTVGQDPQENRDSYDDVYTDLERDENGRAVSRIFDTAEGVVTEVSQSQGFKHVVLNVPKGKPSINIEPQTSSTDAFNLANQGIEEATPVVIDAGDVFEADAAIEVKPTIEDPEEIPVRRASARQGEADQNPAVPAPIMTDAKNAANLILDVIKSDLDEDRTYDVRCDESRLTQDQMGIIEEYVRILNKKISATVKLKKFSGERIKGDRVPLISVTATGKGFRGEGNVDVQIPEGRLDEYFLRITGMVNIALASSAIPENVTDDEMKTTYGAILGFISRQYKVIVGADFVMPETAEQMIDAVKYIVLMIPRADKMPLNKIDEFNKLAKETLASV